MVDSYDAIVVGAGPAGSAAALTMAREGLSVALLERGEYPGSKNVFGGTIYRQPTAEICPAFWHEAPLERAIINDELWLLETDSAVRMGFTSKRFARDPYNKFAVYRAHFDKWLARQAQEAGAILRNRACARDFTYDKALVTKGPINGVRLDTGETLRANVVVIAEGVNPLLTGKAGLLKKQLPPAAFTLYVKEVLGLPQEKINERFHLENDEGSIIGMFGYPNATGVGKAALWTYRETLSLIVGGPLSQMVSMGLSPYVLLQRVKGHPLVKPLIAGAEPLEYQAHLIPKGGFEFIPQLYGDHVLVTGDAATMISGRRGTDLAMLSGKYAGETTAQAKAKGDFSAKMLANYQVKLQKSFFYEDIKAGREDFLYYKKHPDVDYLLSSTLNDLAYQFFTVDLQNERQKHQQLRNIVAGQQFPLKTLDDLWAGLHHWGAF
ncbi:FAD-dependent oxidoreductase [Moorella sp. Hama-1]|uniref:FAD-dependent oxidoreductase n=1 Tax=Moorella sp. Hama-1 TaxID=2138101 RepID=UPI000D644F6C|nr:FAD-dependent oxidoreductase [Moorella sp. Hama-1]MDN5361272.1 electron transfer flavoprotein-quinone oxidoreductase [Moorella sp. (in: firmicutes)]BCV20212.1 protein FixC [Moorella sp. Hama-1]